MPYFLFSTSQKTRISETFVTEQEICVHVRAQGLCSEVIDREDMDFAVRIQDCSGIHICAAAGRRIGDNAVREWNAR